MDKQSLLKLEKLKAQRAKLEARIQVTHAQAKQSERKSDTRRKILVGSYFLDQAIQNNKMEELKYIMNDYLKRNSERVLFDLSLIEIK